MSLRNYELEYLYKRLGQYVIYPSSLRMIATLAPLEEPGLL